MPKFIRYQHLVGNMNDIFAAGSSPIRTPSAGLFICYNGKARIRLDGNEFNICEKSIIIYYPYSQLEVLERSDDLDGLMMSVDMDSVQPILNKIVDVDALLSIRQHPFRQLNDDDYDVIMEYSSLVLHHQSLSRSYAESDKRRLWQLNNMQLESVKSALILQIVIAYSNDESMLKSSVERRDVIARNFLVHLREDFRKEHEVGYYADRQCLSMRYFSFVIRESTSKTPSQWIASILLTEAKQLLLETGKTVKEVSEVLNFPNQSYFGKWFKQHTGMGPTEFKRRENSGAEIRELTSDDWRTITQIDNNE